MSRAQRWLLWVSAIGSAASGLGYAYMRYALVNDDPFSAFNHPAQPWALDFHVLVSPLLLFTVGWVWGNHVLPKLGRGRAAARRSGLTLLGPAALMTASGYLLQTASVPGWRLALAWVHGLSGGLFVLLMLMHGVTGRSPQTGSLGSTREEGDVPIVRTREGGFAGAWLQPAQDWRRKRRSARRTR